MALAKRVLEFASPPLAAAGVVWIGQSLPDGLMEFLAAWTLLSLPVGVVVGHLAMNDD